MGKDFKDREIIWADTIWSFIDEESCEIDTKSEDPIAKSSEAYKMFLLGRREQLDKLITLVREYEKSIERTAESFGVKIEYKD